MPSVNQKVLIQHAADHLEVPHDLAEQCYQAMMTALFETLERREAITLDGFGRFEVYEHYLRPNRKTLIGQASRTIVRDLAFHPDYRLFSALNPDALNSRHTGK